MMNLYKVNQHQEYTGESKPYDPMQGRPIDWVRTDQEPPQTTPPQVAYWAVNQWKVRDEPYTPPTPEPVEEVPTEVTRAQGKLALMQAGLWDDVVAYVESITDPMQRAIAEAALYETIHWQRDSPFLNQAAIALGLTSEQLDQLFINADKIHV